MAPNRSTLGITMQIEVQILQSMQPIGLHLVAECTVALVKEALSIWGPPLRMHQTYMGTVLADNHHLKEYNLAEGALLHMTMHPWRILVKLESTGDTMPLNIFATDTIGFVKAQIRASEGIPTESQWITFQGELLLDSRTVDECNIQNGSTIGLVLLAETID